MKQNETNAGGTSLVNAWKMELTKTPPAERREFKPLVVKRHPEQDRMDAFNSLPSQYKA